MFNDAGLGEAMELSAARDRAEKAQKAASDLLVEVESLKWRLAHLEKALSQVIAHLNKQGDR